MRRGERACRQKGPSIEEAHDTVDFRGLQGLRERHFGENRGESHCHHILFLLNLVMARNRPHEVDSAQALLHMVKNSGIVFNWNVGYTTENSSLNDVLVRQVAIPNSKGIFIESYRIDWVDTPDIINVDHDQITITNSSAFITNLGFRGPGHHSPTIPSSYRSLPFVTP